MGYDNVLELLVDFHYLEFHCLVDVYIVVADGAHIDLRTGEERLDSEDVDDHATFGAALDIAFDDFIVFESLVDTIPRTGLAGFLVGETELTVLVLESLDEYLYIVAYLEVGVVAELGYGDDCVRLHAYIDTHFALGDSFHLAGYDLVIFGSSESLVVDFLYFLVVLLAYNVAFLIGIPVEILDGGLNF